jgi:uncharacterized protein
VSEPQNNPAESAGPVIDAGLLEILACPETHQPLHQASASELTAVNARIAAGKQKNVGGESISDEIDAGLVREDGKILYPIRDAIPVMLIDEGLPL